MKHMTFYDENQKYSLYIHGGKSEALAQKNEGCHLYPSLSCDIGLALRGVPYSDGVTPEALRAMSFCFGVVAGWPMDDITVECENGKEICLPLVHKKEDMIPIKTKICKDLFENITVFSSSVSHSAALIQHEHSFVFIESNLPSSVNLAAAEGLRGSKPIEQLPILFGSLSGDALHLNAVRLAHVDDLVIAHLLCYLARIGHAAYGKVYKYKGGLFHVISPFLVCSCRRLKILS